MPASTRWKGPQRRIGLTGGIASGKSTVARWLSRQGIPVLDADIFAREALGPGCPATAAVLARYGEAVRDANDSATATVNRGALGSIVFSEPAERIWLEQLLHPLVRERFETALSQLHSAETVALVIPLLFEAGLEGLCSEIWLVDCEPEQQLQRLTKRDGLSTTAALNRINAQWPMELKRQLTDQAIDNRATDPELMHGQLDALLGVRSRGL